MISSFPAYCRHLLLVVAVVLFAGVLFARAEEHGDSIISFDGPPPKIANPSSKIKYDLDLAQEKYLIHVPANYTGAEPFGLILYLDPGDGLDKVPPDWALVLRRQKLLLAAPQKCGNDQNVDRRLGLAVLGTMKMQERYKIDSKRIYAAGFSGGARMANRLGFLASDLFRGTIQACGADFYQPVPKVAVQPADAPAQLELSDLRHEAYGVANADVSPEQIAVAKQRERFVFITGEKDFRYADIQDIYNGGFAKNGFQANLMLIPGMQHQPFDGGVLAKAIDFIQSSSAASSKPSAPDWLAKDQKQWPQVLLSNEIHLKDNTSIAGASGFLMRLADGTVVACTAKHVAPEEIKLPDLDASIKSWVMYPRETPLKKVVLGKLAMDTAPTEPLDWLVMSVPAQKGPFPAEQLLARESPLVPGETIYVFGVPYDEHSAQNVYKGTVLQRRDNAEFEFQIDGTVATRGFSGAPIMDANGQLAAVFTGHITDQNVPGKMLLVGVDTAWVLDSIKVPKPPPVVKQPAAPEKPPIQQTAAPNAPPKPPTDSKEAQADAALRAVQPYIDSQLLDKAREKLNLIIQTYPGTPAAEKAQKMLADLEEK
jgi:hypothetical protein